MTKIWKNGPADNMPDFKEILVSALIAKAKALGRHLTKLEIVDVCVSTHEAAKPAPRQKAKSSTDSDWITELEQDPALTGIDVKKQLGMAQFWCRQRNRKCTRLFFVNWLGKAERIITVNADGKSSKVSVVASIYEIPPQWEPAAIRLYGAGVASRMVANGWLEISPDMRANILRNIR